MSMPTYEVGGLRAGTLPRSGRRDGVRHRSAHGRKAAAPPYELDDVMTMIRLTYAGRVAFHAGDEEIAPGVSVHHIGGHTPGLQSVRVHTERGWMMLASDASHYYEHFEDGRVFPVTVNLAEVIQGYAA